MARALTALQRKTLKARAHNLRPVVVIGEKGLTDSVLHEVDVNLTCHELIKIRMAGEERERREAMLAMICARLSALPVQHIGRILVVYRQRPEQPQLSGMRQTDPARHRAANARPLRKRLRPMRPRATGARSAAARPAAPRARTR